MLLFISDGIFFGLRQSMLWRLRDRGNGPLLSRRSVLGRVESPCLEAELVLRLSYFHRQLHFSACACALQSMRHVLGL